MNTETITHAQVLQLVQEADSMVEAHHERIGIFASSTGILLAAIQIASDNVEELAGLKLCISLEGYTIEFDSDLTGELEVLDYLYRALSILGETMADED